VSTKPLPESTARRSRYFDCSCGSHSLNFLKWDDEDELYVSIWERGGTGKMPLYLRLKTCWKILTEGSPYGDEVVFNKQNALELSQYLTTLFKNKIKK